MKRTGRPRTNVPRTKRGKELQALIIERWGGVLGMSRETGLDRGTVTRLILTDDPSRMSSASLDVAAAAGIPARLLGRTG